MANEMKKKKAGGAAAKPKLVPPESKNVF